jgi:hypothetical protein
VDEGVHEKPGALAGLPEPSARLSPRPTRSPSTPAPPKDPNQS